MNIVQARIATVLYALLIIAFGKYNLLWYVGIMQLSLEILNTRKLYLQHPYKIYNLIFWSYDLVLLERLRKSHFSPPTEWLLNCAEHVVFGVIICLKIYIYAAVFTKANTLARWKRTALAFVLFNIIGLINEIFQNLLAHRNLFVLIEDSIKDLWMNFLGASVFVLAALCRIYWLQKNSMH